MALGKQPKARQRDVWVAAWDLPHSPGHPFYRKLNEVLAASDFDAFVEDLCAPFYAERLGRPSVPPGVYFRMLLIGYFEGIGSQRGIAWRCADSRSLVEFLGYPPTERTPDHSSLTRIRRRLPLEVHEQVFVKVLQVAHDHGLLKGRSVAIDATTLEANAAMKSIVRKHSGADWKAYLTQLAQEAGLEEPTDEDLRRFDRERKGKKVSNRDWESPSDPDARIARMKKGETHLAYKAEHAVDLDSDLALAAKVQPADRGDPDTLPETLVQAQLNAREAGSAEAIRDVVADRGYHKAGTLAGLAACGVRTYIPERRSRGPRRWTDKPAGQRRAFYGNRRRCRGSRGRKLQRLRSEKTERSFAHVCETGGARRTWIRGRLEVAKRYVIQVAGYNLGVILRALFGIGTPRSLQGLSAVLLALLQALDSLVEALTGRRCAPRARRGAEDPIHVSIHPVAHPATLLSPAA
jgi:transposase